MTLEKTILETKDLTVGYATKEVLSDLDLELKSGELTCLLGPNGSGKSTLMRSLAGIQRPLRGSVMYGKKLVGDISSKDLATKLSLVLTDRTTPGNLTAYAVVSLGRFPYTGWLGTLSKNDKSKVQWAMEATGSEKFANTHIAELSDGERQKVMIARSLAQDTPVIFLDEPTAHLDLPNRLEVFHLLKELAASSEKSILLTSHEMDMSLGNADRLWLVSKNKKIDSGVPEDLVLNGALENAFARENLDFDYEAGGFKRKVEGAGEKIYIEGSNVLVKWTRSAFERKGYQVVPHELATILISVVGELGNAEWKNNERGTTHKTIEELLANL